MIVKTPYNIYCDEAFGFRTSFGTIYIIGCFTFNLLILFIQSRIMLFQKCMNLF